MTHTFSTNNTIQVLDAPEQQTSANTAWERVFSDAHRVVYLVHHTAVGTSLAFKLTQAEDASGTGAKDVDGTAVTVLPADITAGKRYTTIEIAPGALDDGFEYVRAEVTATGTCVWGVTQIKHRLRNAPPYTAPSTRHADIEIAY